MKKPPAVIKFEQDGLFSMGYRKRQPLSIPKGGVFYWTYEFGEEKPDPWQPLLSLLRAVI